MGRIIQSIKHLRVVVMCTLLAACTPSITLCLYNQLDGDITIHFPDYSLEVKSLAIAESSIALNFYRNFKIESDNGLHCYEVPDKVVEKWSGESGLFTFRVNAVLAQDNSIYVYNTSTLADKHFYKKSAPVQADGLPLRPIDCA